MSDIGRRGFLGGGLAGMVSNWTGGDPGTGQPGRMRGGLPPRRPDQQYRPTGAQGPVGSSTGIVKARQVIVSGPNDGVYVYSGKPATGNLLASVNAFFGMDPFGLNSTVPGDAAYTSLSGTFIAVSVWDGGVFWYTAPSATSPYTQKNQIAVANTLGNLGIGEPSRNLTLLGLLEIFNTSQALISAAGSPSPATSALLELQGTMALKDETAPSSVSGNAQPFGNSGSLNNVNGADGNTYDTERLSVPIAAASYSNTSGDPATIASAGVGNGQQYDIDAWFLYKGGAAAGTPQVIVTGPAESSAMLGINFFGNAASVVQTGAMTYGAASTGPTFQTGFGMVRISGLITFSAAGTLELQIYTSSASDDFIVGGGVLRLMPIAA